MNENTEFIAFPKMPRLNRETIITEKIDGTNAQIFIHDDGVTMQVGSRNRWVTPADDNYGFANWAEANKTELLKLGPGRHFGEYWGAGIQRRYGLQEKRFSLFNANRWAPAGDGAGVIELKDGVEIGAGPKCCYVVPVLYRGLLNPLKIVRVTEVLRESGSVAAPGFMQPEGIVVFHVAAQQCFKVTLDNDESPKGLVKIGKLDMKIEIVYKVVRNVAGKLYSNNIAPRPEYRKVGTSLRYIPGRTRKPKIANSKLFAFSSLQEAKAYSRINREVWRCEATGVTPGAMLGNEYGDSPALVREIFAGDCDLSDFCPDRYFRHVVFCDTIKLLELV